MADEKRTQVNIAVSDEEKVAIQEAAKKHGVSQAEFLRQAMRAAVMDETKAAVPEAASDVDAFNAHVEAMQDLYRMALQRSQEAYEIAAYKVHDELKALATLTEDNKRLTDENRQLEADVGAAKTEAGRVSQELAEAQKKAAEALAEAQAKAAEADDLRKQLVEAREQYLKLSELRTTEMAQHAEEMAGLREQHAEEMAEERKAHAAAMEKIRAEGFQQLLEFAKAQQSKGSK